MFVLSIPSLRASTKQQFRLRGLISHHLEHSARFSTAIKISSPLHIQTLCKKSQYFSELTGCDVYLKFENTQPSGSFKMRGIGHLCKSEFENGCTEFVSSSAGNAGLAGAYSAEQLGVPITVFLPTTTLDFVLNTIKFYGAKTVKYGDVVDETNAKATAVAEATGASFIHPFDNPLIFEGHSTLISELEVKPDLLICSVGGGGLLAGLLHGLKRRRWSDVKVISVETIGADSMYQSIKKKERVTLPEITSVAKSIGVKTVGEIPFNDAMEYGVVPWRVTDYETVQAISQFLDEERMMVEPACACCFVPLYNGDIKKIISMKDWTNINKILIVVCGGACVNTSLIKDWKNTYEIK